MSNFQQFGLHDDLNKLLGEIGFEEPTPIQENAIPKVLEGRDLIASAQTGTGKTAAFLLPILHAITQEKMEKKVSPHALILVPTRELAMQVAAEAKNFSKYMPRVKTACIYGGIPYPIQRKTLSQPYQILVATPGRLIDHLERGRINLSQVKVFVLDEADRMLDMGFIPAVEAISELLPEKRQTLLFSATIDKKIAPICKKLLTNPVEVQVDHGNAYKNTIDQKLYYVDNIHHKIQLLEHILGDEEVNQTIVFTSTINQAKNLSERLAEMGYSSDALHGDMSQRERTRTIGKLKKQQIDVLVATDVAARGIDIATLSHVVNFDLPFRPEDFIHRVGRTGRAGATGIAITFATYKETQAVSKINKLLGKPIEPSTISGLEPKTTMASTAPDRRKPGRGGQGPRNQKSSFFGAAKRRPREDSFQKRRFPKRAP